MEVKNLNQNRSGIDRRQQNTSTTIERRCSIDRRESSSLWQDAQNKNDLALSIVPLSRRFLTINNSIKDHDYIKAAGRASLLGLNLKADLTSFKEAAKQLISLDFKKNWAQNPFLFTANTSLENIEWLVKCDKTLFDFKSVKSVLKNVGMKDFNYTEKGIKITGSKLSKIMGKTFLRIPVLSLLILIILELPSIIKAKNPKEQLCKSLLSVTAGLSMSALAGAAGSLFWGAAGSLIGFGLGSYYADKLIKSLFLPKQSING